MNTIIWKVIYFILETICRIITYGSLLVMTYFMKKIQGLFICDFRLMEMYFPVVRSTSQVFTVTALGLILLIFIWQVFRNFGAGILGDVENPVPLLIKTVLFTFMIMNARTVCSFFMRMANGITGMLWDEASYTALDLGRIFDSITADFADESIAMTIGETADNTLFSDSFSLVGSDVLGTLVAIIIVACLMIAIAWNFLKLILEIGERYIVMCILFIGSPLAFAAGASNSTSSIFRGWVRMYASSLFMMVLNTWSIQLAMSSLAQYTIYGGTGSPTGTPTGGVPVQPIEGNTLLWAIMTFAFLKCAQSLDEYLNSMGLSTAKTGRGLLEDAFAVTRTLAQTAMMTKHLTGGGRSSRTTRAAGDRIDSKTITGGAGGGVSGSKFNNAAFNAKPTQTQRESFENKAKAAAMKAGLSDQNIDGAKWGRTDRNGNTYGIAGDGTTKLRRDAGGNISALSDDGRRVAGKRSPDGTITTYDPGTGERTTFNAAKQTVTTTSGDGSVTTTTYANGSQVTEDKNAHTTTQRSPDGCERVEYGEGSPEYEKGIASRETDHHSCKMTTTMRDGQSIVTDCDTANGPDQGMNRAAMQNAERAAALGDIPSGSVPVNRNAAGMSDRDIQGVKWKDAGNGIETGRTKNGAVVARDSQGNLFTRNQNGSWNMYSPSTGKFYGGASDTLINNLASAGGSASGAVTASSLGRTISAAGAVGVSSKTSTASANAPRRDTEKITAAGGAMAPDSGMGDGYASISSAHIGNRDIAEADKLWGKPENGIQMCRTADGTTMARDAKNNIITKNADGTYNMRGTDENGEYTSGGHYFGMNREEMIAAAKAHGMSDEAVGTITSANFGQKAVAAGNGPREIQDTVPHDTGSSVSNIIAGHEGSVPMREGLSAGNDNFSSSNAGLETEDRKPSSRSIRNAEWTALPGTNIETATTPEGISLVKGSDGYVYGKRSDGAMYSRYKENEDGRFVRSRVAENRVPADVVGTFAAMEAHRQASEAAYPAQSAAGNIPAVSVTDRQNVPPERAAQQSSAAVSGDSGIISREPVAHRNMLGETTVRDGDGNIYVPAGDRFDRYSPDGTATERGITRDRMRPDILSAYDAAAESSGGSMTGYDSSERSVLSERSSINKQPTLGYTDDGVPVVTDPRGEHSYTRSGTSGYYDKYDARNEYEGTVFRDNVPNNIASMLDRAQSEAPVHDAVPRDSSLDTYSRSETGADVRGGSLGSVTDIAADRDSGAPVNVTGTAGRHEEYSGAAIGQQTFTAADPGEGMSDVSAKVPDEPDEPWHNAAAGYRAGKTRDTAGNTTGSESGARADNIPQERIQEAGETGGIVYSDRHGPLNYNIPSVSMAYGENRIPVFTDRHTGCEYTYCGGNKFNRRDSSGNITFGLSPEEVPSNVLNAMKTRNAEDTPGQRRRIAGGRPDPGKRSARAENRRGKAQKKNGKR